MRITKESLSSLSKYSRNFRGVTSALSASKGGLGYPMKRKWAGGGPPPWDWPPHPPEPPLAAGGHNPGRHPTHRAATPLRPPLGHHPTGHPPHPPGPPRPLRNYAAYYGYHTTGPRYGTRPPDHHTTTGHNAPTTRHHAHYEPPGATPLGHLRAAATQPTGYRIPPQTGALLGPTPTTESTAPTTEPPQLRSHHHYGPQRYGPQRPLQPPTTEATTPTTEAPTTEATTPTTEATTPTTEATTPTTESTTEITTPSTEPTTETTTLITETTTEVTTPTPEAITEITTDATEVITEATTSTTESGTETANSETIPTAYNLRFHPFVNGPSVNRLMRSIRNDVRFVCVTVKTEENGEEITSRGCAVASDTDEQTCGNIGSTLECDVCDTDACNSATGLRLSFAALLVTIVAIYSQIVYFKPSVADVDTALVIMAVNCPRVLGKHEVTQIQISQSETNKEIIWMIRALNYGMWLYM
ncbi:hypothetical protein EVAR_76670_1 [Eumeta japonica]|uniref:Uncharacterized protein n=1 Tax=Eumeta variegata TaxID=151549 RepID=A0A4C1YI26_EUMVA|nr:hypothetical protein EVAR_76670_1 [Eumeta japonica]